MDKMVEGVLMALFGAFVLMGITGEEGAKTADGPDCSKAAISRTLTRREREELCAEMFRADDGSERKHPTWERGGGG